jgi:hypothetical protein
MRRTPAIALIALLICAALGAAQNPPTPPKPGPEQQKLAYFLGTWKSEVNMKPSPFGPGGTFAGLEHNEWMPGGFFVVSHSKGDSPMGKVTGTAYFGYDPERKVYTYNAFNSTGEAEAATGTVNGDTWTWTNQQPMNGKMMKGRFTMTITSPTAYTMKFEMGPADGDYSTLMEGSATKVVTKAPAKKK